MTLSKLFRPGVWMLGAAGCLIAFAGCQTPPTAQAVAGLKPAEALLALDRPLVIAHRGFSSVAPENTLAAFRAAAHAGADLTELDYHHSRDGRLVVIHDGTLDRTSDATNRWGGRRITVGSKTFAELRELDAGSWFGPGFAGERIPELGESLDLIQHSGVTLIERKGGDAAGCVELVRAKGLVNHVVVQSFDWSYLRDYHEREPDQILAALGPPGSWEGRQLSDEEKQLDAAWCDRVQSLGARIVAWNRMVDRRAIQAAHRRGLKVFVYTINDEKTAHQHLDAGVDGIITDQPTMLWKVLAGRGR